MIPVIAALRILVKICKYIIQYLSNSQNSRITEWLRLEGSTGGHVVQPPCSSKHLMLMFMKEMCECLLAALFLLFIIKLYAKKVLQSKFKSIKVTHVSLYYMHITQY